MLATALLVILCAEPPAPPSPQQRVAELNRLAEKRMQILTFVASTVRPPGEATANDVSSLRAALSDALETFTECETLSVKNAAALKLSSKDLDKLHKVRLSLDELLKALTGPEDAKAVAARVTAQFAPKPPPDLEIEARVVLKVLFVTEMSFFQEMDRYSTDFQRIGFAPEGCRDGTRPQVPDSSWIAGCRFIYRVEVKGTCPDCRFEAIAKGVADPVRGVRYTIGSESGSTPARLESETP